MDDETIANAQAYVDRRTPSYADAKFMLVGCAAFVNYLWTKAAELGPKIKRA
jgi:hypothetical protein